MDIEEAARRIAATGDSAPRVARDPVNLPMIHHWLDAMGDTNPVYERDGLAPPAMIQVWTMPGLRRPTGVTDPFAEMLAALDDAGYTSIVATNSEQSYHRYLRQGEVIEVRTRLSDVVGPKRTALGEGYFVTTESTWYSGTEAVGTMLFRVLKFRPSGQAPVAKPAGDVIRPVVSRDTKFFWDGTALNELRIQRCRACGELRHPPGPACPTCGALEPGYVVAAGTGEIYSYVVHRHPPVPGRELPIVVALVALTEGVRMVGEVRGVEPDEVRIGAPVRVEFVKVDDDLTLPAWRLA
ncbi:OB-fold domain-containing protein [Virgisporangium ochraceum]|uniref:DNA-binding protein n=1 Tax=Virgisporangium ochraceum TaxID=65505 RepID=A0A8J3ZYU8_9ACTN|nr:DNA-binding protein [Virgisporangium ochraceum]